MNVNNTLTVYVLFVCNELNFIFWKRDSRKHNELNQNTINDSEYNSNNKGLFLDGSLLQMS